MNSHTFGLRLLLKLAAVHFVCVCHGYSPPKGFPTRRPKPFHLCGSHSTIAPQSSSSDADHDTERADGDSSRFDVVTRRSSLSTLPILALCCNYPTVSNAALAKKAGSSLALVQDPNTYSALLYAPPKQPAGKLLPLLVVLHGAGKNDRDAWDLADLQGEHAGLIPSLLANGIAPAELAENFCVVAPYASNLRSFYEEPRSKLLQFVSWTCSDEGRLAGCPENIDKDNIFLFGFSDGATVAVELATTRLFRAVVVAAYGFSGKLPKLALERLSNIPFWVFHSADDVIFPVAYSDRLVESLRSVSTEDASLTRYTRYDQDPEGFTGSVRGHSTGISASKLPELYRWMLSTSRR